MRFLGAHWLINCSLLKNSKLWQGSAEQFDFEHRGVTVGDALERIAKLERCDDRTLHEDEYLFLLKQAVDNWPNAAEDSE